MMCHSEHFACCFSYFHMLLTRFQWLYDSFAPFSVCCFLLYGFHYLFGCLAFSASFSYYILSYETHRVLISAVTQCPNITVRLDQNELQW